jgi:DnaJ-domain-containing protein 1
MSIGRRIRNIAVSQLGAIKDRIDRIDAEMEEEHARQLTRRQSERDAKNELDDPFDLRSNLRTPEEIATGRTKEAPSSTRTLASSPQTESRVSPVKAAPVNPLTHHYKVLGVDEGSDFQTVQAAYSKLAARCSPDRFPDNSEEQKTVIEIRQRVDSSYNSLRDALDPTSGRFDKLEL